MLDRGLMAGTNVNTSASGSITGFSDCGQATAIEWAVGAVLHYCTDAGTFMLQAVATCAQMAVLLTNCCQLMSK